MTEKPVNTRVGQFDRARLKLLKEAIDGQDKDAVVSFEGAELHVGYGQYLVEYIEGELGKRNTNGL